MFVLKEVLSNKKYSSVKISKDPFVSGNFIQSYEWGEFLKNQSIIIKRIVILNQSQEVIGRATLIIRTLFSFLKYAYCPFGPELPYNKLDQKQLTLIFYQIKKFLKKEHCCFFRFNPPLKKNQLFRIPDLKVSLAKSKQPEKTSFLDLTKSEEDLLKSMKQKTRYNIRLAQRKHVTIKKETSKKGFNIFLDLSNITSKRDQFSLHSPKHYQNMIETLGPKKIVKLYVAYLKNKPLAANIVIFYNHSVTYLHGASSNSHRNLMPTYLLQWQAMIDAKKKGFKYYDFWGINEKTWPGVTRFKNGFGGTTVRFHTTYEISIQKSFHFVYNFLRKITKK
jgi:lipid II:glycine glycyltransferase (peptidoglycan interpeptide bridge formation enzyme)